MTHGFGYNACQAPEIFLSLPVSASPVLRLQLCTAPGWDLHLGPHACGAITLPTGLSPYTSHLLFQPRLYRDFKVRPACFCSDPNMLRYTFEDGILLGTMNLFSAYVVSSFLGSEIRYHHRIWLINCTIIWRLRCTEQRFSKDSP